MLRDVPWVWGFFTYGEVSRRYLPGYGDVGAGGWRAQGMVSGKVGIGTSISRKFSGGP